MQISALVLTQTIVSLLWYDYTNVLIKRNMFIPLQRMETVELDLLINAS